MMDDISKWLGGMIEVDGGCGAHVRARYCVII